MNVKRKSSVVCTYCAVRENVISRSSDCVLNTRASVESAMSACCLYSTTCLPVTSASCSGAGHKYYITYCGCIPCSVGNKNPFNPHERIVCVVYLASWVSVGVCFYENNVIHS